MSWGHKIVWGAVFICAITVFFALVPLTTYSKTELSVTFIDVGQGDAIFIESPSGRQILIDGGADRSVLRGLGEIMSWNDRTIDVVIATL